MSALGQKRWLGVAPAAAPATDDLRQGTLVELLPDYASLTIGIHAVYPTRKYLPMKGRRMVDFLVDSFATTPWIA